MKTIRLFAEGVDDAQIKFVLISQINESGELNQEVESFGYMTDYELDSEQHTKSIFQLTFRNGTGVMFYGDNTYDPTTTNIYSKQIKAGERFPVFYQHDDPDTNVSILVIRNLTDY